MLLLPPTCAGRPRRSFPRRRQGLPASPRAATAATPRTAAASRAARCRGSCCAGDSRWRASKKEVVVSGGAVEVLSGSGAALLFNERVVRRAASRSTVDGSWKKRLFGGCTHELGESEIPSADFIPKAWRVLEKLGNPPHPINIQSLDPSSQFSSLVLLCLVACRRFLLSPRFWSGDWIHYLDGITIRLCSSLGLYDRSNACKFCSPNGSTHGSLR